MRYQKHISSLILLFTFTLIIAACSKNSKGPNESGESGEFAAGFALYEFDDAMEGIYDATLEKGMGFHSYFDKKDFPQHNGKGFMHGPKHRGGKKDGKGIHPPKRHMGRILKTLNLSDDQKSTVKDYMSTSRECVREPFEDFREAARPFIEAANEERRAILQQVRDGLITRDEAHDLIQALNESTREAIENCPACVTAREAMCACKLELFANIESILTGDQLTTWNDWLSTLDSPCLP